MFEDKIEKMNENIGTIPMIEYEKRVYTPEEIQDILGVSRTTIYQLIKSKVFHSVRVGGQYRISKRSFDKWLEESDEEL
ncbi:helix-turn-helix domain-containing protein [Longibaculum muris]|uniref:helix-turn-helix domain-containing protein n=1 Tax=Longibaculum muris TaxID=1796628 RepID=UPI0029432EDE|nr:helix-turn-helix domain-containing protein [Longibaculum muris]